MSEAFSQFGTEEKVREGGIGRVGGVHDFDFLEAFILKSWESELEFQMRYILCFSETRAHVVQAGLYVVEVILNTRVSWLHLQSTGIIGHSLRSAGGRAQDFGALPAEPHPQP